jgi:hypothetical protein
MCSNLRPLLNTYTYTTIFIQIALSLGSVYGMYL